MALGSTAERLEGDLSLNCAPQLPTTRSVVFNCGAIALAFINAPPPTQNLKIKVARANVRAGQSGR